jgi:hypothetical protein
MINIHQIVTLICDKNQRKSKNYPPVNLWREKKRTNVADQKGNRKTKDIKHLKESSNFAVELQWAKFLNVKRHQ